MTQTSRAGCHTQVCMVDALVASELTYHRTIVKMLTEEMNSTDGNCSHPLQRMHLSRAVRQQTVTRLEKSLNSTMAEQRRRNWLLLLRWSHRRRIS